MSIDEMRWKITSSLNNLSEKKLEEVLDLIKESEQSKQHAQIDWDITKNMDALIQENMGLLKRLA